MLGVVRRSLSVNERNKEPTLIDHSSVQETHDTKEAVLRNQGRILNVDHVQCSNAVGL
jgi:hypothetical protein